jgi:hypothetical protein
MGSTSIECGTFGLILWFASGTCNSLPFFLLGTPCTSRGILILVFQVPVFVVVFGVWGSYFGLIWFPLDSGPASGPLSCTSVVCVARVSLTENAQFLLAETCTPTVQGAKHGQRIMALV